MWCLLLLTSPAWLAQTGLDSKWGYKPYHNPKSKGTLKKKHWQTNVFGEETECGVLFFILGSIMSKNCSCVFMFLFWRLDLKQSEIFSILFIYFIDNWRLKQSNPLHLNKESIVKLVFYVQVNVQICLNSAEYRPYLMFLYWFSFGVKVPFTFPFFIVLKSNGIPDPCLKKTQKQCSC